jgi:hypothetical protein
MPDYEKAAELLIEKCDKLRERIREIEKKYEDTQQLRQKSAKLIITIVSLNERIAELEAELDWILVSEEMPEQVEGHWGSEFVLATDGKQAWVSKYNYSAYYWGFVAGDIDITHWKPIILP